MIFPLPIDDPANADFMAAVRKRLPSGNLHVLLRGGHEFAMGPVDDLRFLFRWSPRTDDAGRKQTLIPDSDSVDSRSQ